MHGKSQAALEFLTTYGWAFLVIIIMIGALSYFGILTPSKILPNRCSFGSELQCIDFRVVGGPQGNIKLRLRNNLGEPINIQSISVGTGGSANSLACTNPQPIIGWKAGEVQDIDFIDCTNAAAAGILPGEKGKVNITVEYYGISSGSGYSKQIKGDIYTLVS